MNSIKLPGANVVFHAPSNWDEAKHGKCSDLHVFVTPERVCISVWEPTPEERARILAGDNVVLSVAGNQVPVHLSVASIREQGQQLAYLVAE